MVYIPEALQPLAWGGALLIVFALLLLLVRYLRRLAPDDDSILGALRRLVVAVAGEALEALRVEMLSLPLAEQEARVRLLAHDIYATLPDVVVITIRKRHLLIPLKAFLSEELFTRLVVALYFEATDVYKDILRELEEEYQDWQKQGAPLPPVNTLRQL